MTDELELARLKREVAALGERIECLVNATVNTHAPTQPDLAYESARAWKKRALASEAELKRFRDRESLVQALIANCGELPSVRMLDVHGQLSSSTVEVRALDVHNTWEAAKAVRDFKVTE